MDFIVSQVELNKVLSKLQTITSKKTTMPILSSVLLEWGEHGLALSASDLEVSVKAKVPAQVSKPGAVAISSRVLGELIKELDAVDVEFALDSSSILHVTTENNSFKIHGTTASEYPTLKSLDIIPEGKISSATLKDMISRSIYAVCQDETRYNMTGVCFESPTSGELRLVATDGHRLAMVTTIASAAGEFHKNIVPKKGLTELKKFLDTSDDFDASIGISGDFLVLDCPDSRIALQTVDADFPEYSKVIPEQAGMNAIISSDIFTNALRRVALMVTDQGKCIRLDFETDKLVLSSFSHELGEAEERVSIEYVGKPLSIGFNARYLLDIASHTAPDGNLVIELLSETLPARFYAENDESSLAVVMPMRLDD